MIDDDTPEGLEQPMTAGLRCTTNSASRGDYDGAELRPYQGRPGANDALAIPSRFGDELHYRDGRVERLQ